ncbi:hypothetical protein GCM10027271_29180 [Saccharopolyspora gloriosae]|uniref:Uncharacterized protein n=1 Tax=Saccharopolyspora gloriosae TaxID=455344 RepID=A0A840NFP4_9PSEU|nr:hypothetical protein [Saccharopolyspora gloriosae]MBB5071246.1 hypothetical protein [Saccharopolyspora gloriosae]
MKRFTTAAVFATAALLAAPASALAAPAPAVQIQGDVPPDQTAPGGDAPPDQTVPGSGVPADQTASRVGVLGDDKGDDKGDGCDPSTSKPPCDDGGNKPTAVAALQGDESIPAAR